MFKKLNFKTLAIIFGILLVLAVLSQLSKFGSSDSNFKSEIVKIDTSKITAIYLKSESIPNEIKIVRNGKLWTIVSNGKSLATDQQAVSGMINELAGIKAERVAATDKSEWETYKVTDSAGIKVRVEEGSEIIADIIIGKFSYQQNPQKFSTYVRLNNEVEVYSVQGFLSMTFGRGLSDLLDKTLVNTNAANITRITYTYPGDTSFVLENVMNQWKIGDNIADSAKTAQYLQSLAHLTSSEIAHEAAIQGAQLFTVKIEGNSMKPIELKAFASDTITKWLIISDQNPGTRFAGSKSDIVSKIFASKQQFLTLKH